MPRPELPPSLGNGQNHRVLEFRLKDLQTCLKKELISEEEYCSTKRRLLESFSIINNAPVTVVRPDEMAQQSSFQEDPADRPTLMRVGFGLLVSRHARQRRDESVYDIGVQALAAEQRYKFYCDLIKKSDVPSPTAGVSSQELTAKKSVCNVSHDKKLKSIFVEAVRRRREKSLHASIANLQVYDITAGRVQELFYGKRDDLVDGDQMDATGLVTRLRELELSVTLESAERLIHQVQWAGGSSGKGNHITVEEFDLLLTSLRLAELFTPYAGVFRFREDGQDRCLNKIYICDYNANGNSLEEFDNVEGQKPRDMGSDSPGIDVRHFFFDVQREVQLLKRLEAREQVRWVHVDASEEQGLDRLTVMRLATKYHLHPLAVEDVIENQTPPKVDDFEDHYFVSMDVISLIKIKADGDDGDDGDEGDDGDGRLELGECRVQTQRSNASIFLSKSPACDTLLSIFQDRPDETSWLAMWRGKGKAEEQEQPTPDGTLWKKLRDDIMKMPPMRVRDQKADFLLYEILDKIVNELQPITEAYSQRLGYMHQRDPGTWSADWLEELSEVNLELADLARSIRPMRQVVHHFIHDRQIGRTAQTYLEDTEDQINRTLDDLSQLQEMIGTLIHSYEGSQDKRMNLMLFILSIVSAIFLPAQFVTGLYGMNFEGLMPELEWTEPISGYVYFWILQLAILLFSVCMLFLFHHCSRKPVGMRNCCRRTRKMLRSLCCRRRRKRNREDSNLSGSS